MNTLLRLLLFTVLAQAVAVAQTNFTTVTASKIQDASGALLASGQMCASGVSTSGKPINYQAGGGGLVTTFPVCIAVTNGAIGNYKLANSDYTYPLNVAYLLTVTDNTTGQVILTAGPTQITGSTWSLDNYQPSIGALAQIQNGPTGPKGDTAVSTANGTNGGFVVPGKLTVGQGPVVDITAAAYGAVPGGSVDAASAVNAAVTYANSVGGGIVLFPMGQSFLLNSTVLLKPNVTFMAYGATLLAGVNNLTMIAGHSASRSNVAGLHLSANGKTGVTGILLDTYPNVNITLRDLYLDGGFATGVQGADTYFVNVDNVRVSQPTAYGFNWTVNSNSVLMNQCSVISGAAGVWGVSQNNGGPLTIHASTFEGTAAVRVYQSSGFELSGNYFENTGGTIDHWLELGGSSAIPPQWNQFSFGASVHGNLFGVGAKYAVQFASVNGVSVDANLVNTSMGAWEWYNFDNSYKKGIHIGANSYMNGADLASWYPAGVNYYYGAQPSSSDSLLTTVVDEHFQPQLYNSMPEPQASHMNSNSTATWVDATSKFFLAKSKASDGTVLRWTFTGALGNTLYPDSVNSPNTWLGYGNPAAGVDGAVLQGYGGVRVQKKQGSTVISLAQFGGYTGSAYFGAIGLGAYNTLPTTNVTVHIRDNTPSTGVTQTLIQAGVAQGTAPLLDILNAAGSTHLARVLSTGAYESNGNAGITTTAVAGSCTLTFTGGLLTTKSGC